VIHTGNELGRGADIDADGLTAGGEGFDESGATTGVGSSMRSRGFVKAWIAALAPPTLRALVFEPTGMLLDWLRES
jgi:hypothetical protein